MDILLLRFDAPLMSFGAVKVDDLGQTREHPALSMLTGLVGNALGYEHRDVDATQALQARLKFAVRQDSAGQRLYDFQTVDLGQDFMKSGWTSWHRPQGRGGASGGGTHIRHRWYLADAVYTLAMTLSLNADGPTVGEVESALRHPARPLFLGRKNCLPAAPILLSRIQATSLVQALQQAPMLDRLCYQDRLRAWWPADEDEDSSSSHVVYLTDERDWANQVHVGRRHIREGLIALREAIPHDG